MFRCNLPPALLAERPGSFTCHCGNTGVERTPNKSQHTKLSQEKKILSPLLPGLEMATFRSRVRRSYQQAVSKYQDSAVLEPRIRDQRMQKLKFHLVRTENSSVLPLKPGVGQYIAIHVTLTARDFFLLFTLSIHSPAFSPKPLPIFS